MDQVSFSGDQFQALVTPPVHFIGQGEGISVWALGILVTLKVMGNETGGSYSLWEDVVPPGASPPLHFHTNEDETWYLLDGELEWNVGDKTFLATKGSFVHLPKFVPHAFVNKSSKPARMVLTYTPAGFEGFFLDVGIPTQYPDDMNDLSPPKLSKDELGKAIKLGEGYGMVVVGGHSS